PGQYHDPESGLNYNYHRYYDPETANYQSFDPLGLEPSPNPRAYIQNPLTWYDPLGYSPCTDPPRFITTATGHTIDRQSISTKISQKQLRHIMGRPEYRRGSYLNSTDDARKVLNAFHDGSAKILDVTSNDHIIIRYDGVTGFNMNPSVGYFNQPTNIFMIKGSTHPSVVPTSPR
ncbi:RHS repeat-associated core domain-containing protein, partial [Pseudofrankia asymbiotica]|uniref:RHS repeat-associated core domain-containing protein n=1 Tax=Pseudofrankia asymbiotica TaxID=1834516 RepID=UPI0018E9A203